VCVCLFVSMGLCVMAAGGGCACASVRCLLLLVGLCGKWMNRLQ
jgi:hypothetical protein